MDSLITSFSNYGLDGVVIGALFCALYLMIRELKTMNESHDKRIDALNNEHKAERAEWIAAYKENTEIIRQLSLRQCGFELRKKISE